MSEFYGCNACGSPENWEKLLKEAHDKMDDINASEEAGGECRFCGSPPPYNANGITHTDDCILVKIRKVIVT